MKTCFIHFLGKHPKLYDIAEGFYDIFRSVKFKLYGTKSDEKYWAERHLKESERNQDDWGKGNDDWITGYWNSVDHPHRKILSEAIANFKPSSILEIGCNCGPNLRILSEVFPEAKILGVDINPEAVQKGNELFTKKGLLNVALTECKADELLQCHDHSFDIVFTDAVLIYLGPDKIEKVIKEMLRVSSRAIVLMEWHDFESKYNPLGKHKRHWVRNYKTLLKEYVSADKIKIKKMPDNLWNDKNWQKFGAIIEVVINSR